MITEELRARLFGLQDVPYRDFQAKLMPTLSPDAMIGVRTPALKKLAKEYVKNDGISLFLQDLPHRYFDEDQLHAFLISEIRDYGACIEETERFLPYINNWATCDQLSPKVFKKHKPELLANIRRWLASGQTYIVRFAEGMLMQHYLDEDFDPAFPEMIAGIRSEEYYINMMTAWYFATALAKQYDVVLPYLEERRLDPWTHNKAIQKAVESLRITPEQKAYLRTLRVKKR